MRTTLDIDNDVLQVARDLAKRQQKTTGQMVSELLRQALTTKEGKPDQSREPQTVYGFEPVPSRGGLVTNQLIDDLKDDF